MHVQVPMLLSEYVQEVGRAGRDGKAAIALSLVSEPTGWLDPEDRQRQQFFLQTLKAKYRKALHLAQTLPQTGEVNAIAREFKDGAIALSLLHSIGQLDWIGPFHYRMRSQKQSQKTTTLDTGPHQMMAYLRTHDCRWRFLLNAFGFTQEAQSMHCGQCDRCRRSHKR